MLGASQARGFYARTYLKLLKKYASRADAEVRARDVALEVTKTKFGEEPAIKGQQEYHKGA